MSDILKSAPKSTRKAKGEGHLRRVEILESAERIFSSVGYERATIRKIADDVGVSSTALYIHFRDKDEILHEITQTYLRSLREQNREIAARPIDAVFRIRLMLEGYIHVGLKDPNTFKLVFHTIQQPGEAEHEAQTARLRTGCYRPFWEVVNELARAGRLRSADPDAVGQAMWAACHGLVTLMIVRASFEWVPPETLVPALLDGILYGMISD